MVDVFSMTFDNAIKWTMPTKIKWTMTTDKIIKKDYICEWFVYKGIICLDAFKRQTETPNW